MIKRSMTYLIASARALLRYPFNDAIRVQRNQSLFFDCHQQRLQDAPPMCSLIDS